MAARQARDIVVVGASAGGVEELRTVVARLPRDLPAAVFVVLHVAATGRSVLPEILARAGELPAAHAQNGDKIEHGRIYVAPPDQHLLLHEERVELTRDAKENGHRPAIDPLFRSAAAHFGPRVTGVVLSGTLDDGADGLRMIGLAGGATLVQDPSDAMYDSMPKAAIQYAQPDEVLRSKELGGAITRLATEFRHKEDAMTASGDNPSGGGPGPPGEVIDSSAELAEGPGPGVRSAYACPDCGGGLWEVETGGLLRFRCRVGHAYSEAVMLEAQGQALETALFTSLRIVEERAALSRRLSSRLAKRGSSSASASFGRQAAEAEQCATELKRLLSTMTIGTSPAPATG